MDKQQRKQITQNYKRKELESLAQSEESILASYAKRKLGQFETELSAEKIKSISDSELIEAVVDKINNQVEQIFLSNPKENKSRENVLNGLNKTYQYIYSIYHFQCQVGIGDAEKYFESTLDYDKELLIEAYKFFSQELIIKSIQTEDIKYLEENYKEIKGSSDKSLINYIRTNTEEFK